MSSSLVRAVQVETLGGAVATEKKREKRDKGGGGRFFFKKKNKNKCLFLAVRVKDDIRG